MGDCGGDEAGLAAETFFRFIPAILRLNLARSAEVCYPNKDPYALTGWIH